MAAHPVKGRLLLTLMALAILVRLSRFPTPHAALFGGVEYDPAVMYAAAASWVHGQLPYRDFVFLHPPGILLGLAPFTMAGRLLGDAQGLALARFTVVALGAVNTGLVCLLLRRYGPLATVAGGGLYASWSATAFPEQLPLLEPFLMTALLLAFGLARSDQGRRHALAGVLLGVAVMVKIWAAVDLLLIGALILTRHRARGLAAFVGGAAVGGSALGLPFFLAAPGPMWTMVVAAQLGRPRDRVDPVQRLALFGPAPDPSQAVPVAATVAWVLVLVALAVVAVVRALPGARGPAGRADPTWWAIAALVHGVVLAAAPSFYDHYTLFLAGPLTLVLGHAVAGASPRADGEAPWKLAAATALAAGVALLSVAGSLQRLGTTPLTPNRERLEITAWADRQGCVWASVQELVLFDEVNDTLDSGCGLTVDSYGRTLLAGPDGGDRADPEWKLMLDSDAVVLRRDEATWPLDAGQKLVFVDAFRREAIVGKRSLWVRAR